jgi:GNAT superfamily N-acetyltransferase
MPAAHAHDPLSWRRPAAADLPLLARMNRQLIEDEGSRNPMRIPQLEARMRDWLESGEYDAILFEFHDAVVAYALYQQRTDAIYLRQFFVDRAFRRRGIGRRAIRMLLQDILPAGQRITLEVLTANPDGYAFWKRLGFRDYAVTLEGETG